MSGQHELLLQSIQLAVCQCGSVPQVTPPAEGQVVVVGDTHGQFHDVCRM